MCEEKSEKDMNDFKEFLKKNKDKIDRITESNTPKNKDGLPVITKDDPWRKDTQWDSKCQGLTRAK